MLRNADVFNITETAAFLGVHEQTVRRLARRGAVPAFKVGKDWRFRKEALLHWSENQPRARTRRHSVLVVDDDQKAGRAMGEMVTQLGCRAQYATNGAMGLELVAAEAPDLVLLDLKLPDMTAPQFLAALRKTHPILPLVVATDHPDSELMKQAAQHAPVLLLAKPVDLEPLERTVRAVLGAKMAPPMANGARNGGRP
jgi:excisionase family DNA binding protein